MKIIEVKSGKDARRFLNVARELYKNDKNWICPLDKDIEAIFDPVKNTYFSHGEATRWILADDSGKLLGRVAAFINHKKATSFKLIESIDDMNEDAIKGNFVRVKVDTNEEVDRIKNQLISMGAEDVDFIFENKDEKQELDMIESLSMNSIDDIAVKYIEESKQHNFFNDEIQKLFEQKEINDDYIISIFKEIEEAYLSDWKPA